MGESASVRLKTSCELPSAEIVVLDGNFQFVHRGIGSIDVALPPGVYTVQYRAGAAVQEVPVALRPGSGDVVVSAPELRLHSPAPLAGNDAGALYGELAQAASREVHARPGRGAELFLFVRLAGADAARGVVSTEPLFDVSVLDARGIAVAHLRDTPRRDANERALAYTLELDPGTYFLRFDAGSRGPLEQSCVLCEGWQTQVFASSRRYGDDASTLGPNLPEAAVFMMRQGRGFNAQDARVAWSESARQSLAQGGATAPEQHLRDAVAEARRIRASAAPGQLEAMLKDKFANPMLGIYGLHMLLQSPQRDWALARELVENLELLIGAHPDVTALTLLPELKDLARDAAYPAPPMLRTSWSLIVARSVDAPGLVPHGSYAERVADRMWGAGAWLVWRSPGDEEAGDAAVDDLAVTKAATGATADDLDAALAVLKQYVARRLHEGGFGALAKELAGESRFTDTERSVLLYFAATADRSSRLLQTLRAESGLVDRALDFVRDKLADTGLVERARGFLERELGITLDLTSERLVRALGVPAASLRRAVVSLARKLTQTP
jgi:hypothetical protein